MFSKKALIISAVIIIAGALAVWFFMRRSAARPTMTFAMIKPDAVAAQHTGDIIKEIEAHGFAIARLEQKQLTKEQAEAFYAVHKDKPFFNDLIAFMTSGPVIVMALKKDNAVVAWRELMGSTNPEKAPEGTLRKLFGTSIQANAVHGSDSPETARQELAFFFPDLK